MGACEDPGCVKAEANPKTRNSNTRKPVTHRPLSSSFLGLPYRNLKIKHKKELLRGPWV